MPEYWELDYILDITLSKKEYLCRITNRETGRTSCCRTKIKETGSTIEINEISLVNFARSIHYILSVSMAADMGIGMNDLREKIRSYIYERADYDYFCLDSSGSAVGVFITWEEEDHEA